MDIIKRELVAKPTFYSSEKNTQMQKSFRKNQLLLKGVFAKNKRGWLNAIKKRF